MTRPYRVAKQVQSRVVLAQQTRHVRPSKGTAGRKEGRKHNFGGWKEAATTVVRGPSTACVPTSRISGRYVVDSLPRELNPFRFRYCAPEREIPLDVYSSRLISPRCTCSLARNLQRVLHPVSSRLCILIGSRGLASRVASSIAKLGSSGLSFRP